ncbi:MAG TPA: RICIN domain-containing protein, partial [Polyangiales bacterium]|nr:RICIN domain-containing protein [Polyangiales bacterium]
HAGGSQSGEQQQADGLLSKIAYLRRVASQYNITAAHIYELMDETYWAPHFEAYMGLVHLVKNASGAWTAGTLKPAYNAVKSVLVAAPPATPPPTTPPPTGTVATGRSTLRAVNGGLCMDVQGNSYSAGAPLIQWSCNNSSNQTFIVTALDATRAQIKVASSNLCLRASALTSGSTLVQSGCSATDALQAFTLTPTGAATTFQIKISNGLCVGARNGATGAGPVQDVSDCNATRAFVASGLR